MEAQARPPSQAGILAEKQSCRLCGASEEVRHFFRDKLRDYFVCGVCGIIFVPDTFVVTPEREKSEYDMHDNFNENEGYRRFLSRAIEPLPRYIPHVMDRAEKFGRPLKGLDFGCGPNPLLAKILSSKPYECDMTVYDKFYNTSAVDLDRITEAYDFVTATEVFEHLHHPLQESLNLWRSLVPGGVLIVMTKRAEGSVEKFRNWHYIRDCTHISFFTEDAFRWLASTLTQSTGFRCSVVFEGKDVVVLQKCKSA